MPIDYIESTQPNPVGMEKPKIMVNPANPTHEVIGVRANGEVVVLMSDTAGTVFKSFTAGNFDLTDYVDYVGSLGLVNS